MQAALRVGASLGALLVVLLSAGCSRQSATQAAGEASAATVAVIQADTRDLPLADRQDFEDAARGFIAAPTGQLRADDGRVLKDFDSYRFLDGPAPPTVHPALWRHAQLNARAGLYKVMDGVYQLRGFDIANLTLIQGKTGWIVVDPLTSRESARHAMAFAEKHLGRQLVTGMIFTHAHVDHFGGALGVLTPEEVAQRKIPVVAPAGFIEEATSENILAGTGMGRRSLYQFGRDLPRSATGNVDTGLGKDVVYGAVGILMPNWLILRPTQPMQIDGVDFVFHNVPSSECPAELTFHVPALKLYDGAEILAQTQHNLLPIRGAKVRDALRWAGYLDQALEQIATHGSETYIASHNWPLWGRPRIEGFIRAHRDSYKYLHDQTLRLMNRGYGPREIADLVKLPATLQRQLGVRGYYGDVRHNVKAIYQFYLGFYDGNPAHLNPLPPVESARRWIQLLGGSDKALAAAQAAYDQGDYRWAAELLNHVVFGDPGSKPARELLARTYEQLGYQSEAATWRNAYLTGALELRQGPPKEGASKALVVDMLMQTPIERFLEAMAASLIGPEAEGKDLRIDLVFSDLDESYRLAIENAVLHWRRAKPAGDANATLTLTKALFVKIVAGTAGAKDTLMSDELKVTGSRVDLVRFFALLDKADGKFQVVTREGGKP